MGEMSDVEIRREERGDDSRSLRGGRLVPSDYADKQTPMPFSTAERFDNELATVCSYYTMTAEYKYPHCPPF